MRTNRGFKPRRGYGGKSKVKMRRRVKPGRGGYRL